MADDPTPQRKPASEDESGTRHEGAAVALPSLPTESETGYTPAGVPTLEGVRDKIEARYGTALGATELARDTPEGRAVSERYDAIQEAAAEKLRQIRAAMDGPE